MKNMLVLLAFVHFCSAVQINVVPVSSTERRTKFNLVFIHGLGDNFRSWLKTATDPRIRAVADSYLIDLRNHGNSMWHDSMSYAEMAKDIQEAILLPRYIAIGHSIGCKVANTLAMNYSNVEGVICADSYPLDLRDYLPEIVEDNRKMYEPFLQFDFENKTLEQIHKEIEESIEDSESAEEMKRMVVFKRGQFRWSVNVQALNENAEQIVKYQEGSIKVPYLVLHSSLKHNYDIEIYKEVCPEFDSKRDFKVISNSTHYIHQTNQEETITAILEFLSRIIR